MSSLEFVPRSALWQRHAHMYTHMYKNTSSHNPLWHHPGGPRCQSARCRWEVPRRPDIPGWYYVGPSSALFLLDRQRHPGLVTRSLGTWHGGSPEDCGFPNSPVPLQTELAVPLVGFAFSSQAFFVPKLRAQRERICSDNDLYPPLLHCCLRRCETLQWS